MENWGLQERDGGTSDKAQAIIEFARRQNEVLDQRTNHGMIAVSTGDVQHRQNVRSFYGQANPQNTDPNSPWSAPGHVNPPHLSHVLIQHGIGKPIYVGQTPNDGGCSIAKYQATGNCF